MKISVRAIVTLLAIAVSVFGLHGVPAQAAPAAAVPAAASAMQPTPVQADTVEKPKKQLRGIITAEARWDNCGLVSWCIYLNRDEQNLLTAGLSAAVVGIICLKSGIACVVAAVIVALALQHISNRGGRICSGEMRITVILKPGGTKCV